jgi:4'-phosphopantetheinyl transferase
MTVQVWQVSLSSAVPRLEECRTILSSEEQQRAGRFHFERDRQQFILARAILRMLLSPYVRCKPEAIRFYYGPHGKPTVTGPRGNGADVQFNLSHSGDYCVYALAPDREVGVDLEVIRADIDCLSLAERFFTKHEYESLHELSHDARPARFFRYWTYKEAYLKARGLGLAHGLTGLNPRCRADGSVTFETAGDATEQNRQWMVRPIRLPDPLVAAVAAEGLDWDVAVSRYEGESR